MGLLSLPSTFLCLTVLSVPPPEAADRFVFRPADHLDAGVRFELDAPLGRIEAKAPALEGEMVLRGGRAKGRFRVRVDRIQTGNEGRDRDLEKPGWLDARRFMFIGFTFEDVVTPPDLLAGGSHEVTVRGRFILRGVERPLGVKMQVRFDQATQILHCAGTFSVRLAEHRIQRSDSAVKAMIGLEVGEVATVKLVLQGRRVDPG